jgi:hypothetical protein
MNRPVKYNDSAKTLHGWIYGYPDSVGEIPPAVVSLQRMRSHGSGDDEDPIGAEQQFHCEGTFRKGVGALGDHDGVAFGNGAHNVVGEADQVVKANVSRGNLTERDDPIDRMRRETTCCF